jgi:hypothetical protein
MPSSDRKLELKARHRWLRLFNINDLFVWLYNLGVPETVTIGNLQH